MLGEIRIFAGGYAPAGWAVCDGRELSVRDYKDLFELLGKRYSNAEKTRFTLPNYRGRLLIGQGTGPGLSLRSLGDDGGVESVMLETEHLPPHQHQICVTTAPATESVPNPGMTFGSVKSGYFLYRDTTLAGASVAALSDHTIGTTGKGTPHSNMMPSLCLNYIICIVGENPE